MKKRVLALILCCILILFCGCNGRIVKYKRISFESETLGEDPLARIDENTTVINHVDTTFPTQLPIYKISKHNISREEFQQMEEQLGITQWYFNEYDGHKFYSRLAPYSAPERGAFYTLNMSDEELEALAWETFNKIPFLEGDYKYEGMIGSMEGWSLETGEFVSEAIVSFRRVLDGVPVSGNDRCRLTFDAMGLVEMDIALFDYEKIGTMDVVALEEAEAKIKTPDYFSFSSDYGNSVADTLQVDEIKFSLVNQFANDCTILQPLYTFRGTAAFSDGDRSDFTSRVIAIPESYTYEAK